MDDENIARIAEEYSLLKLSLKELEEIRKDKKGAVLEYVFTYYHYAQKAIEFLRAQLTETLQTRLDIRNLERELIDFGNTHIGL
jgi:hypothetical protein